MDLQTLVLSLIFVISLAILLWLTYDLQRMKKEHQEHMEQRKKAREALDARHKRMEDALERFHAHQHKQMMQLGVKLAREPGFKTSRELEALSEDDMKLLQESGILSDEGFAQDKSALMRDLDAMHQDWMRVGQAMYDVLEAAPDPSECEGLTPDEFENIIRQRLESRRKKD